MALSTKPYKGARDFYPEDKRLQKYMFAKWREVVESFGYEEYDAPILEPLEIFLAKTGEEIVNEQTYTFEDRGKRQVVIRPEMTPSVSRLVAAKRQELTYPLRWYSLPNLWRYERPQRGRLREHWQLNVDMFGVKDTSAELEMIDLVDSIFKAFGANEDMFTIHLNHRGLVDYLLKNYLNLSQNTSLKVSKLIDRLHKMPRTDFISSLDDILTPKEIKSGANEKLLMLLETKDLNKLPSEVKKQPAYQELADLLTKLKDMGLSHVVYDSSLMRGFDYYTGIVFEVYDTDPSNNRSMMGGGRYDGLVGLFGVEPVATVGFGWGDVTLVNFLETHHLMPDLQPETNLCVLLIGDVLTRAQDVLKQLRQAGIKAAVNLSNKKLGDQLRSVDKRGVKYALIIGEAELKSNKYKLKNLNSGKEKTLDLKGIVKELNDRD